MGSSDVRSGHWQMDPFSYPDLFSKKIALQSSSYWLWNRSKASQQRLGGAIGLTKDLPLRGGVCCLQVSRGSILKLKLEM